jgi:acyl-CoA hydrolase/RimJ/RimL family protein N-acetyltransferase
MMDIERKKGEKITFSKLLDTIKPGSRIFISTGPAAPVQILKRLFSSEHSNLVDIEIIQLVILEEYLPGGKTLKSDIRLKTFIVGENIGKELQKGNIDFIPTNIMQIPYLFATNSLGIDIAIIQTSTPDSKGLLSLGIVADVADCIVRTAPIIIAETNPNVPRTFGETTISLEQIDYIIESKRPPISRKRPSYDETLSAIGWNTANLIDDGSMISMQYGGIYEAIGAHLRNKKNLKVFSYVISDWIIDLIEAGAVAPRADADDQSSIITSSCFGTSKLYRYVDNNPLFMFLPLIQSRHQAQIGTLKNLISVTYVEKIDITADTVVPPLSENILSGFDGKLDFSLGAARSRNGKSIVVLRSTDRDGKSNIVIRHTDPKKWIRSMLGTTQYVVTEYGVANLIGKSIRERGLALIDIAHPEHRRELLRGAKAAGIIYPDQIYNVKNSVNYPHNIEKIQSFGRDLVVRIRAIKPSDEDMMRRFFYHFSEESRYLRFFSRISAMPHKKMQAYVSVDYVSSLSLVAIISQRGTERIIGECRYAYDAHNGYHEMAFLVDEEFQGRGIGTYLVDYILNIAQKKRIKKVRAAVLPENINMINIFNNVPFISVVLSVDKEIIFEFSL